MVNTDTDPRAAERRRFASTGSSRRNVALTSPEVAKPIDVAFAIVDVDGALGEEIRQSLIAALARGGPADNLRADDAEQYLTQAVSRIARNTGGVDAAVILAVRMRSDLIVVSVHGGTASLCRDESVFEIQLEPVFPSDPLEVRAGRTTVTGNDCLVLLGPSIAQCVDRGELLQTVHAYDSMEDAAIWFMTLGSRRTGQTSSALVVRLTASLPGIASVAFRWRPPPVRFPTLPRPRAAAPPEPAVWEAPPQADTTRHRALPGRGRLLGGALVLVALLAALLIGSVFYFHIFPPRHSAGPKIIPTAAPARAPDGLRSRQEAGMAEFLSWRPVTGATGYIVTIRHHAYSASGPQLLLRDTLRPGRLDGWQVQARLGGHLGPPSASSRFTITPVPFASWRFPRLRSPAGTVSLVLVNPGPSTVTALFVDPGSGKPVAPSVFLQARSTATAGFPTRQTSGPLPSLRVSASGPILAIRRLTSGKVVRSEFAIPGFR